MKNERKIKEALNKKLMEKQNKTTFKKNNDPILKTSFNKRNKIFG